MYSKTTDVQTMTSCIYKFHAYKHVDIFNWMLNFSTRHSDAQSEILNRNPGAVYSGC